ncbi:DUF58 domain-containing protein [Halapricum sp. CBA1109]|uniref:DUF58 domain-containing protein n=1 Tax=Halapricum sp. CBA1109 TaxID=2668068 RepID=UPI0012F8E538
MNASVHRFSAGLSGTLFLVSLGLLYGEPSVLLLALVPLGYVAYGALSTPPEPTLSVERSLSARTVGPGDTATVEVTVTNTGDRTLPDVRVVDGVPESLVVSEGSPRGFASLRSGESLTLSYAVVATRGEYEFDPPTVRCRSLSATRVVTRPAAVDGDETLVCSTTVERPPVERATQTRTGTLPTDSGGAGLAFHSTREYRHGDPTSRIDWRRLAKTDDLSTVNYREEHAPRTVVVVDARPPTRVVPEAGYPSGAELAGYAANRTYESLTAAGHGVGVAALGLDDVGVEGHDGETIPWVSAEGRGSTVPSAAVLFDAVAAAGAAGGSEADSPDGAADARHRRRVGAGPALAVAARRRGAVLHAAVRRQGGHHRADAPDPATRPVTVLSPDVTAATESLGGRVVASNRADRVAALRDGAVPVVDWSPSASLDTALGELMAR